MDAEQQKICDQVVDAWVNGQGDKPSLPTLIWNALDARLPYLVWQSLQRRHSTFVDKLADSALEQWIRDGEVGLPSPPRDLKEKIDAILDGIDPLLLLDVTRRRQARIYRFAESGVTASDIAKTMKLSLRQAQHYIKSARAHVADLRTQMAEFEPAGSQIASGAPSSQAGNGANAPSDEPAVMDIKKEAQISEGSPRRVKKNASVRQQILARPVDELELGHRSASCLKSENIKTVGQLVKMTKAELLAIPNLGRKSAQEIVEVLELRELALKG